MKANEFATNVDHMCELSQSQALRLSQPQAAHLQQQVLPECAADAAISQGDELLLTLHQRSAAAMAQQCSINVELSHVVHNHSHLRMWGVRGRLGQWEWRQQQRQEVNAG